MKTLVVVCNIFKCDFVKTEVENLNKSIYSPEALNELRSKGLDIMTPDEFVEAYNIETISTLDTFITFITSI